MLEVEQDFLSLNSKLFGIQKDKEVYNIRLQNNDLVINITNLGCSITSIFAPARNGVTKNIVAGFANLKDYEINRDYFGCMLGRYANRIAGGIFYIDGKKISLSVNDGVNHLHGGFNGFNKKIWDISSIIQNKEQVSVEFEYLSPDEEEGYPGNLRVKTKVTLNNKNQLHIEYNAETDKSTPVNLSNHSYFNLSGFENPLVTDHILQINSLNYTEKNELNLPTGNIFPVSNTALDFVIPQKIGKNINQFPLDKGFDHNYILNKEFPEDVVLAAQLKDPASGRTVKVFTSQTAIQIYTANFWDGTILGQQGKYYQKHGAIALETQAFPDSPNHASFPDTILNPGEHYYTTTIYEFGVE